MPPLKPYQAIPIRECGEALAAIPRAPFALAEPHPYAALGAPYGAAHPWMLRQSIVTSLLKAQENLAGLRPGWKIFLFDAFRPVDVQAFMFQHEFRKLAQTEGLNPDHLSPADHDKLRARVLCVWAWPSEDPATPPPHSTGAVFDCSLRDDKGNEVDMGSPIDEISDRTLPNYFAHAPDEAGKRAHHNRVFLRDLLQNEGFVRNPNEWWHFSRGDQLATWVQSPQGIAIYGRVKYSEL